MHSCSLFNVTVFMSLNHFAHFFADHVGRDGDNTFTADSNDRQGQVIIATVQVEACRGVSCHITGIIQVAAGILQADDVREVMG